MSNNNNTAFLSARLPYWAGVYQNQVGSNVVGGVVPPSNSMEREVVGAGATRENLYAQTPQSAADQTPMIVIETSLEGFKRRLDLLEESLQRLQTNLAILRAGLIQYILKNNPQDNPFAE